MNRTDEVRSLLAMSPSEVIERADGRLLLCDTIDELHRRFARDIADQIAQNNASDRGTRLVVPVGPTGQYPILADILNAEEIDLSAVWFFFMDEYSDKRGHAIPADHPLSFKGVAERLLFSRLEGGRRPPADRVVFPDEHNVSSIPGLIRDAGGIDVCYGGIGIHGHVAFNEPEPGVSGMGARRVQLDPYTVTINVVRSRVGGNLACFPDTAFTIGMREILDAKRIVLFCRNGTNFDWANTVLRIALFGEPGDDYPVTHVRSRDYTIVTDRDTLATPQVQL